MNLTLDGVSDVEETTVGGYIAVNTDDDNTNTTPDKDEWRQVPGEDDLCKLTLEALPAAGPADVILNATEGGQRIKVWTTATKDAQVRLPATFDVTELPKELWVEGYAGSVWRQDVTLRLSLQEVECYDEVRLTVWNVGLLPVSPAIMVGGKDSDVHKGRVTALVWPAPPSGDVVFSVVGATGEHTPAAIKPATPLSNGVATATLRSSDAVEDITVRAAFGGAVATRAMPQQPGVCEAFVFPNLWIPDGKSLHDITFKLVTAEGTPVPGHDMEFVIKGVVDLTTGQPVEDRALWPRYVELTVPHAVTQADGVATGKMRAGLYPGVISVGVEDGDVWQ